MMDSKNNELDKEDKEIKWLDAKEDFIIKRDEKLLLGLYRILKLHWKFVFGFLLGALFMGLIFK